MSRSLSLADLTPAQRKQLEARIAPVRIVKPKVRRRAVVVPDVPLAQLVRTDDTLAGTIWTPPRTKKNSQSIGWRKIGGESKPFIRQSESSRGFAQAVMAAILPHKARLKLPLPDRDYALSAVYYYDSSKPDVAGLLQALQDALAGARVVSDDKWFNPVERQYRVYEPHDPRVTFTITPAWP